MANVLEKFGLRPYRSINGASWNNAQNRYIISANATNAIYQGDLVVAQTDGSIVRATAGTSTAVLGVFNGCEYTDPVTKKPTFSNWYPGAINSSNITGFVVDDPDTVFLINADAQFTRADVFKNYSISNTTGNAATGISEVQLDVSESGTNASFIVQAIDICQDQDNSSQVGANANILVRINNHQYRSGTGV